MHTITVKLHRRQQEFRRSDALFRGFVGGRGSGKTWVGAYDLIRRAKRGHTYVATSPTYTKLEDEVIHTMREVGRSLGVWQESGFRSTPRPSVRLTTGATIRFRSTQEPDTLRGPNLSGFWMDEASLTEEEAYLIAIACLREGGQMGWLSATFTPQGKGHWTYQTFGTGRPNTALFQSHTRQNPFLPRGFAQTIAEQYGGVDSLRSRQELGGEFVQIEGAEWPESYFPDSMWWEGPWPTTQIRTLALDPSKGRKADQGDYSAWVMLGRDREGMLWCEADLGRRPAEVIVSDGLALARDFLPDLIVVEGNSFQELLAAEFHRQCRLAKLNLPIITYTNLAPKETRIRRLGPLLARQSIRFRDTPGTRMCVQQMQDFPEGEHDDGPDALEMALRGMLELATGKVRKR